MTFRSYFYAVLYLQAETNDDVNDNDVRWVGLHADTNETWTSPRTLNAATFI